MYALFYKKNIGKRKCIKLLNRINYVLAQYGIIIPVFTQKRNKKILKAV